MMCMFDDKVGDCAQASVARDPEAFAFYAPQPGSVGE